MSGDKGGSKADTLVKVVLFFFISLLSFSVGTFVGKQVSDSDHRRMALEGEYSGRQVAATEDHGAAVADVEDKVSDREVAALTEEFVNREKTNREPAQAVAKENLHGTPEAQPKTADGYKAYPRANKADAPTKDVKPAATEPAKQATHGTRKPTSKTMPDQAAPVPHADTLNKTADKVADGQAPTDGAKEEKAPAAGLPSVASSAVGKYTVQVGSYLEEKEAKNRAAELKGKGWNSFYLPATVKGKTWYRVLVGLFNNQDSAKQFRAQFMKEANTQSAIVQKIVQ